jgi:hypothetical protein
MQYYTLKPTPPHQMHFLRPCHTPIYEMSSFRLERLIGEFWVSSSPFSSSPILLSPSSPFSHLSSHSHPPHPHPHPHFSHSPPFYHFCHHYATFMSPFCHLPATSCHLSVTAMRATLPFYHHAIFLLLFCLPPFCHFFLPLFATFLPPFYHLLSPFFLPLSPFYHLVPFSPPPSSSHAPSPPSCLLTLIFSCSPQHNTTQTVLVSEYWKCFRLVDLQSLAVVCRSIRNLVRPILERFFEFRYFSIFENLQNISKN